jgi:hypothetical protein
LLVSERQPGLRLSAVVRRVTTVSVPVVRNGVRTLALHGWSPEGGERFVGWRP